MDNIVMETLGETSLNELRSSYQDKVEGTKAVEVGKIIHLSIKNYSRVEKIAGLTAALMFELLNELIDEAKSRDN